MRACRPLVEKVIRVSPTKERKAMKSGETRDLAKVIALSCFFQRSREHLRSRCVLGTIHVIQIMLPPFVTLLMALLMAPQASAHRQSPLKIDVDLVLVNAAVIDQEGRPV